MVSVFDIFKIGIGPSSSHTVGPMVAAGRFLARLERLGRIKDVARVRCVLYGSLAFTGKGHGTDTAVMLGLAGERPAEIDPNAIAGLVQTIQSSGLLKLGGVREIGFATDTDLVFDFKTPSPGHPNGMRLIAYDKDGNEIANRVYFSVGGGFVVSEDQYQSGEPAGGGLDGRQVKHPFRNARQLLDICTRENKSVAEIALENERCLRSADEVDAGLDRILAAMMSCIDRGLAAEGILPGGLKVRRRAKVVYDKAIADEARNLKYPHQCLDRVSAFAIAVNEENAGGGRVVTSPTNGAAGVTPAVIRYYRDLCPGADRGGMHKFLLTAAAFGAVIKYNASLSGAEVGCQGEVGSASAMAAAGLCAALGGDNEQVENAAEIALEHHLGMTCDPVGGLAQVPCIERNAMGAVKAINAASLALAGDGKHIVFFDTVVETMRQTGLDMQSKYKETSQGGLAVTVVEC
jgi:L-serine dehydratase